MKRIFISVFTIALLGAMTGCSNDNDNDVIPPGNGNGGGEADYTLSENITEDMTLTADNVWTLDGRVSVTSGATLTIEPGTIIKGMAGTGADASSLIIARGAKVMANGTADKPIIFTSITDNIKVGQKAGTNLTLSDRGLWGGVLILGNAPVSLEGGAVEGQVEGIPASDTNAKFGGTNASDNSGVFNYVSIRYAGTIIAPDNEINGLSLGGVGSGTTISNLELMAAKDDGIEFFGGTVNVSNVLVWSQADDGLDIDEAYSGTISNSVVIEGDQSDSGMEIDGPEGPAQGSFTAKNITLMGNVDAVGDHIVDLRDGAQGALNNLFITGFKATANVQIKSNSVAANFVSGKLTFSDWVFEGVDNPGSLFIESAADGESTLIDPLFPIQAESWVTVGTSGGADLSVFAWTQASANGAL